MSPVCRIRGMLLEEVFSPIFFYYPNGFKDRSVWEPRDTRKYIGKWYKLAAMRTRVTPDATATEHGEQLSNDQVSQIFKCYLQDMKTELRPDQFNKPWTYYKSCAEAKMRREAGRTFVANAIWAPSIAIVCYKATRRAAIRTRPGSRPRSYSQCVELVRPYCQFAQATPDNARVSRCFAKIRSCARRIRSHCYRA